MKKKKRDWVDKRLLEINKWGLFSLLEHLFAEYHYSSNKTESTLLHNPGRNPEYEGSPLQVHRLLTAKVKDVYHRELSKLENQILEGKS